MAEKIKVHPGKEIKISWERAGVPMGALTTTMVEENYNKQGDKVPEGKIGVAQMTTYESVGFFGSAWQGLKRAGGMVTMVVEFVYDLVRLRVSPKMIGGPVFIAQMAGQTAQAGFSALLVFIALLSVNLAVLNVLPIPVLDGGHLLFLVIEKIKGSPLTMNQRMLAQQVGLVFLLLFIVWVTYNDIMRFITG
jgi:regulator of sigma E protease